MGFGRDGALFMNPYTGAAIGPGSKTHDVLHVIEDWHRWLGSRDLGRPITGRGQPGVPRARAERPLPLVAARLEPAGREGGHRPRRAAARPRRNFNWHNSVGFWCAPVLIVLTLTGAVMSYQWANDLLYRITGNEPPPPAGGAPAGAARAGRPEGRERRHRAPPWTSTRSRPAPPASPRVGGHHASAARAPRRARDGLHPGAAELASEPALRAHARRVDGGGRPVGAVQRGQCGRKLRVLVRVLHTGEVGGWIGQLVAGLASLGGALPGLDRRVARRSAGARVGRSAQQPRPRPREPSADLEAGPDQPVRELERRAAAQPRRWLPRYF